MNSKRKDLQYASVFLLAVALTFLMGKGDNLWLVSWGDLIPSLFVLFIAGDCLHSSLLRIKSGEENGGARWSTCFINPEKPDVPLNKNDAFQKVQKRRVQEKR